MSMPKGSINWYVCPVCDGLTVTIHKDDGITPSRIDCRASGHVGKCAGQAASAWYPNAPLPLQRAYSVWAWYQPDIAMLKASDNPPDDATVTYLEQGGLLLQPVVMTEQLRTVLRAERKGINVDAPRPLRPVGRKRLAAPGAGFTNLPRPFRRVGK